MKKKILCVSIIVMVILLIVPYASFCLDTSSYTKIYENPEGSTTFFNKGGKILGVVQAAGMGIAVIMLTVIAVKYMMASVEEKAQLKERLIPYLIGAILIFAGSNILTIVVKFVGEIET